MIHTRFKTCSGNTPRRTPAHQTKSTKCCGRLLVKVNVHEYASMLWVSFVKHQQPDRKIVYPSAPKILQRNQAQCCQCTGCRCTFMLHLHSCSTAAGRRGAESMQGRAERAIDSSSINRGVGFSFAYSDDHQRLSELFVNQQCTQQLMSRRAFKKGDIFVITGRRFLLLQNLSHKNLVTKSQTTGG